MDDVVVGYLAQATGTSAPQVAAELELGERKRAFVVHELIDAGLTGHELIETAVRLTGLDEHQVRNLLR